MPTLESDDMLYKQAIDQQTSCEKCGSNMWLKSGIDRFGEDIAITLKCKNCSTTRFTKWRLFRGKMKRIA